VQTIKGDPDAVLSVAPVGPGPTKLLKKTIRFTTAGIEVKEFPEVWLNSTSMWEITIEPEEEGLRGKVYVILWWKKMVH
jgi:protein TonB